MAAAAMSHRRIVLVEWRIELNMGRNLKKFSVARKRYIITFVKRVDLTEARVFSLLGSHL